MNLKTVEVCVETVAIGNVSDQAHGELTIDLRPDVHQIGHLQGSPSKPCSDTTHLNLTDETQGQRPGRRSGDGRVTIQVVQSDSVREVLETGRDVREDWTSGDPN